jgi:hypothetical protein
MSLSGIKVKKAELITRIQANMEKHKADYDKAHTVWRKMFSDALAGFTGLVKEGKLGIPSYINQFMRENEEPMQFLRDYEAALDMLDMSVDKEVVMHSQEFRCLVRDEWDWKTRFSATNAKYSGIG